MKRLDTIDELQPQQEHASRLPRISYSFSSWDFPLLCCFTSRDTIEEDDTRNESYTAPDGFKGSCDDVLEHEKALSLSFDEDFNNMQESGELDTATKASQVELPLLSIALSISQGGGSDYYYFCSLSQWVSS